MAEHDDLYRDPALSEHWEYAMNGLLAMGHTTVYDSVVEWSRALRDGPVDPAAYRKAILALMSGERRPVTAHYHLTAREDRFHRLVAGQPANVDVCLPWVDDPSAQSYGPIPTPVSFVPPLLDDLEQAGYMRDGVVMKEVGSGSGLFTAAVALMRTARLKLLGLDWNDAAVEVARRTADSLGSEDVRFETGRAQEMDLSTGDIFYLHSPFMRGSPAELRFCGRLIREAESRPLAIATLYDVTLPFSLRLPQLNTHDGQDGIALFGTRR